MGALNGRKFHVVAQGQCNHFPHAGCIPCGMFHAGDGFPGDGVGNVTSTVASV